MRNIHGARVTTRPGQFSLARFFRFNVVGATGIAVQASVLALLMQVAGLHYLLATALAVEAALLHNFIWHTKWTWADRRNSNVALMLVRFNLTVGAVCIIGNVAVMSVLVGRIGLNAYAANLTAIALCSLINFALADRVVFV